MTLPIFNRFLNFDKEQEPTVRAMFEDVIRESQGVRYVDSVPTDDQVGNGEFVIMDDGTTKRIYVRTGKNNVHYLTLT